MKRIKGWMSTSRKLGKRRPLFIETLESRNLFAGLACDDTLDATAFSPKSTGLFQSDAYVAAADAGSTRSTAARLGTLNGSQQLNGSLGTFDLIDAFQFNLTQSASFETTLTGLRRDADLYVTNASGQVIGRSNNRGTTSESIILNLTVGDYYVFVVANSVYSNSYVLNVNATSSGATPTSPTPVTPTPVTPTPTPVIPTPTPVTPTPTTGSTVKPLTDVAYYGGARDWNLNYVGAPEAWNAGYTGRGVIVAVIDTGIDLTHPDLTQNIYTNTGEIAGNGIDDDGNGFIDDVHGYDFVDRDNTPNDLNGHGTHVAGTIAASRNGVGTTGIAPDAKILPVRVLDKNGSGSDANVAAGIRYAVKSGAKIINLSLGGGYSSVIDAAVQYAKSLGTLIVAAAGNESASSPGYPARFSAANDNVISVGAFNSSGVLASFSNKVGSSRSIQVDAPGVGIYSTYINGTYATLTGTSMAAPEIAGLAALILSANPNLTSREIRDLLATGTVTKATGSDSIGIANATTSVAYAAAGLKTAPSSTGVSSTTVAGSSSNQSATRIRTTSTDELTNSYLVDATASDLQSSKNGISANEILGLVAYPVGTGSPFLTSISIPNVTTTGLKVSSIDELFALDEFLNDDVEDDANEDALLPFASLS